MTVAAYQDALRQVADTQESLTFIAGQIKLAMVAFTEWEDVAPEALNGSLDKALRAWPSRDEIDQAVKKWKAAKLTAQRVWDELSDRDRVGFRPPHEFKP